MEANTANAKVELLAKDEPFTTDFVTSRDGTTIGYRQLGHGPGLVIVHGAMSYSQTHIELAKALADSFTVYLPDRRGRGLSGPYGNNYSVRKEVEDLEALLTKTSTHNIFGISSGGLISLQAGLALPTIYKVAVYEPPLSVNGSAKTTWLQKYDRQIGQGKIAAALVTGMKGTKIGPAILNLMPNWLLARLTDKMMASENEKAKSDEVTWEKLAPTLHYDGQLMVECAETLENYRAIQAEMLLLGGSKSPRYLKTAVDALEKVLPNVKRFEFAGEGHDAAVNSDRRGKPELVAQELRQFFSYNDFH